MGLKIFFAVAIVLLTPFLLSVFGPWHSEKKFWKAIYWIRAKMDLAVYWLLTLCLIATVVSAFYYIITRYLLHL